MDQVTILGSASAVPGINQENTHLFVQAGRHFILVDSPGNPVVRLRQAGIDPLSITDIILTHFHPDHVAGFAPLLMDLWLMGKKTPLFVHGLEETIERARRMMDLYSWRDWPDFYEVQFSAVSPSERSPVIENGALNVLASSVKHLIPTIGLRFENEGRSVVYSCDTEPSPVVARLAAGADILIHEATGEGVGHTSPRQAGEIAGQAGVKALYLIHYSLAIQDPDTMIAEARQAFAGPVSVARDLMRIAF